MVYSYLLQFAVAMYCRRQTAEEREAERQAANRFMLSLHAASSAAGGDGAESEKTSLHAARDPLCLNNASLHALQNLRPWADDNSVARHHSDALSDDHNDLINDEEDDDDDDDVSDATDEHDVNNQRYDSAPAGASSAVQLQQLSRPVQLHQPYLTAA